MSQFYEVSSSSHNSVEGPDEDAGYRADLIVTSLKKLDSMYLKKMPMIQDMMKIQMIPEAMLQRYPRD